METRIFNTQAQLRSVGDGKSRRIGGYAAKYRITSNPIPSRDGGKFIEMLEHGAFNDALASRDLDCVCLQQHDPQKVLGRTKSGTLRLSSDEIGLKFECDLPNTSYADDLFESVKRGDLNECSFGFGDVEDQWDYHNGDMPFRTINRIGILRDVSVCTGPAYPRTEVGVRSDVSLVEVRSRQLESKPNWRQGIGWRSSCESFGLSPDTAAVAQLLAAYEERDTNSRVVVARRRSTLEFLLG